VKLANDLDGQGLAKAIGFLDPTAAQHLATKAYVDALVQGLDPKGSAVVVAASNITLSGTQTIDGVAVTAGQIVLAVGQSTASQNGPWVVAAGAWTRPTNFASGATVHPGAYLLIDNGTSYKGHGFILTGASDVTVDSGSQTWQEFTGAGDLSATSPVVITGNVLSLTTVPVNKGGTNATDAAGAKTNLGFTTKYAASIGNGSLSAITVTHSLGTTDLSSILVYRLSDGVVVEPDLTIVDGNTITVTFGFVPTTNSYRVIVTA
jgi:hypothetical protein